MIAGSHPEAWNELRAFSRSQCGGILTRSRASCTPPSEGLPFQSTLISRWLPARPWAPSGVVPRSHGASDLSLTYQT